MTRPERSGYRIDTKFLFGKYRIISTLGAGSSGTVYLAEHLKLKVYRAIKCIPKDTARNTSNFSEEELLKEASLLKNLNHPGIPLIYDIDEDDRFFYMIEEFIQGDSLEDLILHQETIPEEQLINYGIQICAVLDYLHHLSPYPVLYEDLKPEHIILCGNQIKIIDFGIASFITVLGKNIQLYGTDGYAAPEAVNGNAVTAASDIYSLGKVLETLAGACTPGCSETLTHIIKKAADPNLDSRYRSASDLMLALSESAGQKTPAKKGILFRQAFKKRFSACHSFSHLIKNIAVIGSRSGAGATFFSVSLVNILNHKHIPCCYMPMDHSDNLISMTQAGISLTENQGIFQSKNFTAAPCYGPGIEDPVLPSVIRVRDFGTHTSEYFDSGHFDLTFILLSGSPWDIADTLAFTSQFKNTEPPVYICNHGNKNAARKYARYLKNPVYCFPLDTNPFHITPEKERLFLQILQRKELIHHPEYRKN